MSPCHAHRRSPLAAAAALLLLTAGSLAHAAIVTSGFVNPDPTSGFVSTRLDIGTSGDGAVTVNGGSTLQAARISAGHPGAVGTLTVTGTGSSVQAVFGLPGDFLNTDIGQSGVGRLDVLSGGRFVNGGTDVDCQLNCRLFVSNAAGSNGTLNVAGAGSSLSTAGHVHIGHASLFTQAVNGFDFGTPGATSSATAHVTAGAAVTSRSLIIGNVSLQGNAAGGERATGQVLLDGIGSAWNLVRQAAQTGAAALMNLTTSANSTATLDVRNGAALRLDGSASPLDLSGINVGTAAGTNATSSSATINVTGPGSRIEFTGGNGFINLGRGNGNVAQMTLANGGVLTGMTDHALGFVSVGRGGATGTLTVDGTGSLMRLSGGDAVGAGAFLHVGRFDVTAGTGTVNVRNGGRIEIDDRGQVLTSNNQTGFIVGNTAGSLGMMTINGPGSVVQVAGSTGRTPYVGIGRDGGTGQLTISAGGRLEVSSDHVSVPNPALYLAGDGVFLGVGVREFGSDGLPTTGMLTVTGAGSAVVMSGTADRLVQVGRGAGASGTLNIGQGGTVQTTALLIGDGTGATGTLNMSGGVLILDGERRGGPAPGGGGMSIGRRDGGVGVANITNGSTITITTTAADGGIAIGGSTVNPGGTGTMLVSGGSTVNVSGPSVAVTAGSQGSNQSPGAGTLILSGTGTSLNVTGGTGVRVLAGNFAGSTGLINVGAGTTLTTTGLLGVAHNGSGASGGTGLLVVDGTVNANQVFLAPGGVLVGNGVVNADVVNQGGISVGHSPGRMFFNGAFDSDAGQIVLEIDALAGGGFDVDELVFGDPTRVLIGHADIVFRFLGDTDPAAFNAAGLFDLPTFFKEGGPGGYQGLDDTHRDWFSAASFSAQSDRYDIRSFTFDPLTGAASFDIGATVPLPGSLALLLAALPWLARRPRRAAVQPPLLPAS